MSASLPSEPAIAARGLSYTYPRMTSPVLAAFDLTVRRGEIVAVTGSSGCGKSTLLYLLGLLLHPQEGAIEIAGTRVDNLDDADRSRLRASSIGFVFQDAALHPSWTVRENIEEAGLYVGMTRREAPRRAAAIAERYGVAHLLSRGATELSGGQGQRVALCRALLRTPIILLADEPTGNLDPENAEAVVQGLLDAAREGAAVIVVTHSSSVADACERTVRLV
jgi:ABC-type lipoprotein export system ATPase subunit